MLFQAHSGLRYLVLLAGAVAAVWFLFGWISRKRYGPPAPAALAAFVGLLDLQGLIGVVMYVAGRRAPGIVDHLVVMLGAIVVVHLMAITIKKRPGPIGYGLPLATVALGLALIVLGIRLLGRPIF